MPQSGCTHVAVIRWYDEGNSRQVHCQQLGVHSSVVQWMSTISSGANVNLIKNFLLVLRCRNEIGCCIGPWNEYDKLSNEITCYLGKNSYMGRDRVPSVPVLLATTGGQLMVQYGTSQKVAQWWHLCCAKKEVVTEGLR